MSTACFLSGVLALVPQAQETRPATEPALDFDQLVKDVRAAHRDAKAPEKLDAFNAKLDVSSFDEGKITITLVVQCLAPDLMRYEIDEGQTPKERGIDRRGEWARVGRSVKDLQGERSDRELLEVRRHLRVCQQLLRFVDPASVLQELRERAPIERRTIAVSAKENAVPCLVVRGQLGTFPLFHESDAQRAPDVRVELCFAEGTKRLVAFAATPLDAAKRPAGTSEWTTLVEHESRGGIMLPRKIRVHDRGEGAARERFLIEIEKISWNPSLKPEDFDRNKAMR